MNLSIKYRPKSFADFIGNKGAVLSLKSVLDRKNKDEIPQAFLFSGQRGCGKTTLARILKNELGCSDFDYLELNTANNRGIDTAREIITSSSLKSLSGGIKVYLFDEFHMTTKEHQNALLKVVEEPPVGVYFIFVTTEPEKIIAPLKSRCTHIELTLLSSLNLEKVLDRVISDERILIKGEVKKRIVEEAKGVPREALIMLDSIKDLKKQSEQEEALFSLSIKQEKSVIDLCRALLDKKRWKEISVILSSLEDDPEKIRRAILSYFSSVLIGNRVPLHNRAAFIIECFLYNYYDTGKAGLYLSCYQVTGDGNN